jgi:hypothetical protein
MEHQPISINHRPSKPGVVGSIPASPTNHNQSFINARRQPQPVTVGSPSPLFRRERRFNQDDFVFGSLMIKAEIQWKGEPLAVEKPWFDSFRIYATTGAAVLSFSSTVRYSS